MDVAWADLHAKHRTPVHDSELEPRLVLKSSMFCVEAAVASRKNIDFRKSETVYIAAASVRKGGKSLRETREPHELQYTVPDRRSRHLLLVSSFLSLSLDQSENSRRVFSFVL
jgi:hypothetical protein